MKPDLIPTTTTTTSSTTTTTPTTNNNNNNDLPSSTNTPSNQPSGKPSSSQPPGSLAPGAQSTTTTSMTPELMLSSIQDKTQIKEPEEMQPSKPTGDSVSQQQQQQQQQQQPTSSTDQSTKQSPNQAQDSAANPAAQQPPETFHPLQHSWTLYFDTRLSKRTSASGGGGHATGGQAYEAGLQPIGTFQSVEQFCRYFNWTVIPSKMDMNSSVQLFKAHIKPMWEDPANSKVSLFLLLLFFWLISPLSYDQC
jgi:translation initiation factor 4E